MRLELLRDRKLDTYTCSYTVNVDDETERMHVVYSVSKSPLQLFFSIFREKKSTLFHEVFIEFFRSERKNHNNFLGLPFSIFPFKIKSTYDRMSATLQIETRVSAVSPLICQNASVFFREYFLILFFSSLLYNKTLNTLNAAITLISIINVIFYCKFSLIIRKEGSSRLLSQNLERVPFVYYF